MPSLGYAVFLLVSWPSDWHPELSRAILKRVRLKNWLRLKRLASPVRSAQDCRIGDKPLCRFTCDGAGLSETPE